MILFPRCAKRDVVAITHAFGLQRNLSARGGRRAGSQHCASVVNLTRDVVRRAREGPNACREVMEELAILSY